MINVVIFLFHVIFTVGSAVVKLSRQVEIFWGTKLENVTTYLVQLENITSYLAQLQNITYLVRLENIITYLTQKVCSTHRTEAVVRRCSSK